MRTMQTRQTMRMNGVVAWVTAVTAAAMLAGCEVDTHKDGDSDKVKISTPFGGLQVRTNDAVVLESIGLPAYPGAQPVKKEKDNDAADVDLSFGGFQLRVKAMSYRTGDSPEKVEAFYRDGMRRFGDVIACRDDRAVGTPTRTAEGLTCGDMKESHITVENHPAKGELELEAGSKQHRHIVAIDTEGGGTKIGLVALDLPGRNSSDGGNDDNKE